MKRRKSKVNSMDCHCIRLNSGLSIEKIYKIIVVSRIEANIALYVFAFENFCSHYYGFIFFISLSFLSETV